MRHARLPKLLECREAISIKGRQPVGNLAGTWHSIWCRLGAIRWTNFKAKTTSDDGPESRDLRSALGASRLDDGSKERLQLDRLGVAW